MPHLITTTAGPVQMEANQHETQTAQAVAGALPFIASASTWDDEIYFGIPINQELEQQQEVVQLGDLGYWPSGRAFCIFLGLRRPVEPTSFARPAP